MPEPMANSSGRRKREFAFILVSQCGTHSFVFLMPYSMTLVLAGFELPSSLSCNQGALLLKSSTEWLDFKDQGVQ